MLLVGIEPAPHLASEVAFPLMVARSPEARADAALIKEADGEPFR
jgi:hypothetical protein